MGMQIAPDGLPFGNTVERITRPRLNAEGTGQV